MRRSLLHISSSTFVFAASIFGLSLINDPKRLQASAEPTSLLQGCADIPEAVELAQTLHQRSQRIETFIQDIEKRKGELADAEVKLKNSLIELRKVREDINYHKRQLSEDQSIEVSRIIKLYDQMKPEEAAKVLSNLPPEYAAQILARIQPESGAKIMASVDPAQAAIFTSFMGAIRASQ
ncbi:MotE family protein [Paracoccus aestuariivivens]|uniref:Magnesium transporter MgtE intracellular domain-containing protein n=1 Tax=Paracoccus aestuariivivens TaxID=1820333 RepID=A0A6L6JES0_9RHOB|nr:hypothetical protein [Paracoccus aestuariivivens]MTH80026.1 hypothetical protein [Paracoccus aestuariivivens]